MAKVNMRKSDKSGALFDFGNTGGRVRVHFNDKSRNQQTADLTDEELEELLKFANFTDVEKRTGLKKHREEL